MSLTLPAGSLVALVGENGAGKTTLVKLLAKLYEPDSGEIDVVASTGNATELVDAVRRLSPHAVLTDIRMPPGHHMEGIEAAHAIRAASPSTGVVVLSQHADES